MSACSCRRPPGMLHASPDATPPGAAAARAYRPADYAPAQLLVESSAFVPAPGLGSQRDWPDAVPGPAVALDWQGWGRAGPAGLQPPWDPPGYDPAVAPARAPPREAAWAAPRPDPGPYDPYARMQAPYLLDQEPRYAALWQAALPAHPGPPPHALLQHWAWEAAAYGGGPWHTLDSQNRAAWPAARREAALPPPCDWPGRPQDADEQHSPGSTHGAGTPPPAGDDEVAGAGWEAGRAPKQRRSHNAGGAAEQREVAEAPQPVGEAAAAVAPHRAAAEGAGLGGAAGAGAADAAAKHSDAPSSADRPNRCRPQRARQLRSFVYDADAKQAAYASCCVAAADTSVNVPPPHTGRRQRRTAAAAARPQPRQTRCACAALPWRRRQRGRASAVTSSSWSSLGTGNSALPALRAAHCFALQRYQRCAVTCNTISAKSHVPPHLV